MKPPTRNTSATRPRRHTILVREPGAVAIAFGIGVRWNDRLYLVGGIGAWAQTLTSFVVYDPSSDTYLSNEQRRDYVRPGVSARALRALVAQSARVAR